MNLSAAIMAIVPQCAPEVPIIQGDGSGSVLVRGSVTQAQIQAVAELVQRQVVVHGMGGSWLMLAWGAS